MGKQRKKSRDEAKIGTGKVTAVQVAFMVECYLRDQQYSKTLTEFKAEASTLISPYKSVPKRLMSLSAILNEYITLKEQQLAVSQEKARIDKLFRGLQDMVGAYQVGSLPAWFPTMQASVDCPPTAVCAARTGSTPVSGAYPCNAGVTMKGSDPRNIINIEQTSVQEVQHAKRKIPVRSRDLPPGDAGGAQLKKARANTGDLAKLQAKRVTSYSTKEVQALNPLQPSTPPVQQFPPIPKNQNAVYVTSMTVHSASLANGHLPCQASQSKVDSQDLQRPTNLSYQNSTNAQINVKLQDPQTPPRAGCYQEDGSTPQTNCSNDNRFDLVDSMYSYSNNSPVYASNATLSESCQQSIDLSCEGQGLRKPQKPSGAGDFNVDHIQIKKQTSKCRTLDFKTPIASNSYLATASPPGQQAFLSEDIERQTSPELSDSFLEDFLSSDAVSPEDLSSIDEILADLGEVSFSDLLGDVIPEEIQEPNLVFHEIQHPETIHEARSFNGNDAYNRTLLRTNDIDVLSQLTDKEMNRQEIRYSGLSPLSPSKNQQTRSGEKLRESQGKENLLVSVRRDKNTASGLRRL
ncbi:hypothetical protein O6H91_20G045900 [Diphasiastrum complanatum]|uniref:Uncharacterized protein n=1 Tax=Diphasiastrum complanatum TaxID=34168 RepID=A0ACC2APZ7_DIPCM|nr:hypothetical protein O6H91_20G045900 [Diphasiastrum complanatum]